MKEELVVIILLNYNGKILTKNCINSIKKNTNYSNYKLIVVDNGSKDDSINFLKKSFKELEIFSIKDNKGFSGGNNEGIKYVKKKYNPDFYYLLSNDTLVQKNWLYELVKCAKRDKKIGVVGSKQFDFNWNPTNCAGEIKFFGVNYYFGEKEKFVKWVCGAGFLIKKEVVEKTKGFNELFNPTYYEETDLFERILKEGYKILYCPKSIILHKGGGTTKEEVNKYQETFYRNRFLFFFIHHPLYLITRIPYDILKGIFKRKLKIIFRGYSSGIKEIVK